jgi:AbrB family looped-hinge helix DNA binding protein
MRFGLAHEGEAPHVLPILNAVLQRATMATAVTSKGQVTIPKPIRDRLGIEPGNLVNFELAPDGRVVLVKVDGARRVSRFEALRGRAGAGLSTDEIMALTRGDD